jgi:hypothetical protein
MEEGVSIAALLRPQLIMLCHVLVVESIIGKMSSPAANDAITSRQIRL